MSWFRAQRSLLLTGVGEIWSTLREEERRGGERSGLLLMVASSASFALMAAFAKKLLPNTPIQAVVFSRGLMMTAIFAAIARWQKAPLVGRRPGMLLLRAAIDLGMHANYSTNVLFLQGVYEYFKISHLTLDSS